MDLKERVKRMIFLEEGGLEPSSEFEKVCIDFTHYLRRESQDFYFMWKDEWLKENFEKIKKIAESEEPALILGESGSGKEIISRFIHFLSKRKDKPFYPMNCSSEHEKDILYSKLFGHERGAYTGAIEKRRGLLKSADGGTVFLDEIQSSSENFQCSLLRFLDYDEIQPLGSDRIESADVRIISASSLLLSELKKRLYPPFYYRISKLKLYIPPLREREIDAYIYYFLLKECRKQRKEQEISKSAMDFLRSLKWEGNLRELRSTIHFLVLMKDEGVIEKEDVLKAMEEGGSFQSNLSSLAKLEEDKFQGLFKRKGLRDLLLEFERELILKALEESGWNVDSAAKLLKISKRTLYYKMRRYKIE